MPRHSVGMARTRLLFACLALAAPATAQAAPPATGLVLSVRTEMGTLSTTRLNCEPAGGLHRNAKEACDGLTPVGGDFTKMKPAADVACTMELNTTTATLNGKWRGKKVTFEQTYSNPCVMRVNTGKVFDF